MIFTVQEITEKLNWLSNIKKQTEQEFKSYLVDKRVPLEERWKVYQKQSTEHLDVNTFAFDFFGIDLDDILSLDSNSRNMFYDYTTLLDSVKQILNTFDEKLTPLQYKLISRYINLNGKNISEISVYDTVVRQVVDAYKEEILKTGCTGIIYDW